MVTDKDSAEIDNSHKTSNKGVAVWLALAVELVKQGPESRTMVRVEHSLKINTTLNLRSDNDQRTRIILA